MDGEPRFIPDSSSHITKSSERIARTLRFFNKAIEGIKQSHPTEIGEIFSTLKENPRLEYAQIIEDSETLANIFDSFNIRPDERTRTRFLGMLLRNASQDDPERQQVLEERYLEIKSQNMSRVNKQRDSEQYEKIAHKGKETRKKIREQNPFVYQKLDQEKVLAIAEMLKNDIEIKAIADKFGITIRKVYHLRDYLQNNFPEYLQKL